MGVACSGHFWQLGSNASLATETTGKEILVAFWPKHGLKNDLRVTNFKHFSWGSMPPHPPSLFVFKHTQWPYQSKIAGSGSDNVHVHNHFHDSFMQKEQ